MRPKWSFRQMRTDFHICILFLSARLHREINGSRLSRKRQKHTKTTAFVSAALQPEDRSRRSLEHYASGLLPSSCPGPSLSVRGGGDTVWGERGVHCRWRLSSYLQLHLQGLHQAALFPVFSFFPKTLFSAVTAGKASSSIRNAPNASPERSAKVLLP